MGIKRKIKFELRPYGKENNLQMIRIRASYTGARLTLSTGCSVTDTKWWDPTAQLVIDGYKGPSGETALTINNTLRNCRDQMDTAFSYFEALSKIPTVEELKANYQLRLSGTVPKMKEQEKKEKKTKEPSFYEVFSDFVIECGEKNAWTEATFEKMAALKCDLVNFDKNLSFSKLTESKLTDFVVYLRDNKQLRTPRKAKGERADYDHDDVVGLKNSTIDKKLGYFRWFMNWATENGYNKNLTYKSFKPKLKRAQKKVIYMTEDELNRLYAMTFDEKTAYLEPVRDVFLFCCFTGLRHSDVFNLRRGDIKGDHMEITTVKTADSISIDLNDIALEILEKYNEKVYPGDKCLPCLCNQNFNRDLKALCKLAGINEKIRITTYKGNERTDEYKEKWELVGSHCGRRTFVVNALSKGIPADIVMKWTGHADYKSMRPYIDIVDSVKAVEMTKLNSIIKK